MRQLAFIMGLALAVTLSVASGTTFAQSSGNFTASFNATECAITASDGTLTGGIAGTSLPDLTIKVSSGSGVALVITPSLVTGLYTKNKLNSTTTTSTQNVGLRVKVTVDGVTTNVIPELGNDGVIYDERFLQVTASFLNGLATCSGDCLTIVESTLSAHSFNFYVSDLTPGTHTIGVSWDILGGTSGEAACVGPGTLTVQQVKDFSFNTSLGF